MHSIIKEAIQEQKEYLIKKTSQYSQKYLDDEYAELSEKLISKMARKRIHNIPFLRQDLDIFAAAIINALGSANFLFDKSSEPYQSLDHICHFFGVRKTSVQTKASQIRKMFRLYPYDNHEFATERVESSNPYNQMYVDPETGFIFLKK